ncbi:uncharacterized protein [Henckelia pumila]|uniref:uncharacterized protein n=1 Tax=Henckelia pumila TaxID=405737 RepID=UPI003C6DEA79
MLTKYRVTVDCFQKVMSFRLEMADEWKFYGDGISVDQSKVEALISWPRPTSVSEMQSFMGLVGYYQRFIRDFLSIAKPITQLTKKNAPYVWTEACEASFIELKKRLTTTPVLTIPSGIGDFTSEVNMRQRRWLDLLKDFDCEFKYYPGKSNAAADELSRKICSLSLSTISVSNLIEDCCTSGLVFETDVKPIRVCAIRAVPELGCDAIWVIIDRMTKTACFVPYKMTYRHDQMAGIYVREVTNGQSERTIQTLEDMLRALVLDFNITWQDSLPLVEFSYNNNYQTSIKMAPFEELYRKKCRSPLYWEDISDVPEFGPDMIREMTEKVKLIQKQMKMAQDRQAKYANIQRRPLCFEQGDRVFLKISPFRGTPEEAELDETLSYFEQPI